MSDSEQSNSDKIINRAAEPDQDDRMSGQHEPGLVSVIIPTYNREALVCQAIQSVLNQSYQNFEIIVVDDGSSDNTAKVVQKYAPGARYVHQENAGASVARNRGIQEAKGEWVAFLDSDDEWLPDKLKLQIDLLQRNPDLVWSYTNYIICFDDTGEQRIAHPYPALQERLLNGKEYFEDYFDAFLAGIPSHTITVIAKRSALETVGMFLQKQPWSQDTDLFMRLAYRWPRIGYLPISLSLNHFGRPDSITHKKYKKRTVKQLCDFVDRHLILAEQQNRISQFEPCAVKMLKTATRSMLRENSLADLSEITQRFNFLLPFNLRAEIKFRKTCPYSSVACLRIYDSIKKILRSVKRGITKLHAP